jgi:hypothetical protein
LRYVACHKSGAAQAALLQNPRKAKEVSALLLLVGIRFGSSVKLRPHPCLRELGEERTLCRAFQAVEAHAAPLADALGLERASDEAGPRTGVERLVSGELTDGIYATLKNLSDEDLDRLLVLLPVLSFGQESDSLDTDETSLFNLIATELAVNIRDWWTPEQTFLGSLRREQLLTIANDSGATGRVGVLTNWSKTELVQALARDFAAGSTPEALETLKDSRDWLPGIFRFPARDDITS